jgi:hypothetical protein
MTSLNVPPELPISFYLLKQCKLWVWDFDDTLIDTSTYLKKNMSPDAILKRCDTELDIEVPQWRYFRKLVEFLVSHGRYVAIASFGTYEIIQAYMKRIMGFNQQFFTKKNIIAPCFQYRDVNRFSLPPNKNEYIYTLMRVYRVQDFKRVVLFDDRPSNIADAIAIGIVGVQIATPNNGDNPATPGKMYFGPWIMDEFDKKIQKTCGDEIYLNRTYTGIAKGANRKETYSGTPAFNDPPNSDINFGTGVRSKDGYFMEEYDFTLGVNDKVNELYNKSTPAFGTGIGDRKVLRQPQYRWNGYKNGSKDTPNPKWYNGNYVNIPGLVKTEGYWDDAGLCGSSLSFWDVHQKALLDTKKDSKQKINPQNETSINESDNTTLGIADGSVSEGFSSRGDNNSDCGCKKFEWNWIILLLVLLIVVMMVIVMRC